MAISSKDPLTLSVAVLVDGGFFLNRYPKTFGKNHSVERIAKNLWDMCRNHAKGHYLYRIFYYDCKPYTLRAHNPISGKSVDFSKTKVAKDRLALFEELKRRRKVALRLGRLKTQHNWMIRPRITKDLIKGRIRLSDLSEDDVVMDLKQKRVDIKIGLDIAHLAYKRLVQRLVLVSGDSDFVPATKLARKEGIDIILDSMWNPVDSALFEHIDGHKSHAPQPAFLKGQSRPK